MTQAATGGSAFYVGSVRHRRHRPRVHRLRHRTYHALLDVDELPALSASVRGFSYGGRAIASFRDRDHLGDDDRPVRMKLAELLASVGVGLPDGPVRVLANLRVLGYVFDPVSWWFCYRSDGVLGVVVAEVRNTFGESTCYVLDHLDVDRRGVVRAEADKVFHVSPFLPIEPLRYRFTFVPPGGRVVAHVDVSDDHGRVLDATQQGTRLPFTTRTLARLLVTSPLLPMRTMLAIHAHALVLWAKRITLHRKPPAPLRATVRGNETVTTDPSSDEAVSASAASGGDR